MSYFSDLFSTLAPFVQFLFGRPFFGFPSFLVFCLVCLALSLVGWILRGMWGGDDK